ncbi:MAG: hypothetical protein IPK90_13595 [Chitinophagaceae bacterium]|nr:hypothetical protein [Chitinophagaceae bacterium]
MSEGGVVSDTEPASIFFISFDDISAIGFFSTVTSWSLFSVDAIAVFASVGIGMASFGLLVSAAAIAGTGLASALSKFGFATVIATSAESESWSSFVEYSVFIFSGFTYRTVDGVSFRSL